MAAINHDGTFYRLDKSSQSGDCGQANVMWPCILQSKQVMPFAFAFKGIPFGYSLTQVKAQSNCIRAGSFLPFPSCHASGTPYGSSTASTHNPYLAFDQSRVSTKCPQGFRGLFFRLVFFKILDHLFMRCGGVFSFITTFWVACFATCHPLIVLCFQHTNLSFQSSDFIS